MADQDVLDEIADGLDRADNIADTLRPLLSLESKYVTPAVGVADAVRKLVDAIRATEGATDAHQAAAAATTVTLTPAPDVKTAAEHGT